NFPVVWVSYYDAAAYCDAYRLCLPNEWEWEAAARGSDARPYPWGRAPLNFYSFSRGKVNRGKRAHTGEGRLASVDAYAGIRTAFGCEQMVGNVSEWCERLTADEEVALLGASSEEPPVKRMRPVRGACFKRFTPQRCICAHRRVLSAGRRNDWVGFRPAMAPSRWWR
ncbi:MAG: SUMF1/EgtB/PvdO family nonheme iron enzyme, partial [Planctomycetales bacterium]|nr:SUMF1/EgtB/PvdO family nonheme iron enzyme [Planctomycetales bacterium]